MSSKRGLGGGGLLGAHLGMAMPKIVRRTADPDENAEGRAHEHFPAARSVPASLHDDDIHGMDVVADDTDVSEPAADDYDARANIDNDHEPDDGHGQEPKPAEEPKPAPARSSPPRSRPASARVPVNHGALYRVGTQKNPYERRDGIRTQKVTFTAPHGLKRDIERFCLDQDISRSEWIAMVLQREMDRVRRSGKKT